MDRRDGQPSSIDFQRADELVQEYLVFRGFLNTTKAFAADRKNDRMKGVQPDRIIEQLQAHITNFDALSLVDLWKYMEARFLSRLDPRFSKTTKKLEDSLKRLYVVHCVQSGNHGKCKEFFEHFADELSLEEGWQPWFMLPFLKSADIPSDLEPYFTKQWQDLVIVSVFNFIATILASVPMPQIVQFDHLLRENGSLTYTTEAQQRELHSLHNSLNIYKKRLQSESEVGHTVTKSSSEPSTSSSSSLRPNVSQRVKRDEDGEDRYRCRQLREYKGHREPVQGIRFSGDGTLLACCTRDKVKVFHSALDDGAVGCVVSLDCLTDINCLEWNGANVQVNKLLLTGHTNGLPNGHSGCVKVWSPEATKCIWEISNDNIKKRVDAITVNPSGTVSVVASDSLQPVTPTSLIAINLRQQKVDTIFEAPVGRGPFAPHIYTMEFNHNGSCFVTGADDGHVRLFDVKQRQPIMVWQAHPRAVDCLHWKQDETSVFTIGNDHVIMEWSIHQAGKVLQSFPMPPCLIPSVIRGGVWHGSTPLPSEEALGEDAVEYVGGWVDILGHNSRRSKYLLSHDFSLSPNGTFLVATPPCCVLQCPIGSTTNPLPLGGRPGYMSSVHWHPTNSAVFAGCGVGDPTPRAYQLGPA